MPATCIYYCFRNPTDQFIIEQDEVTLDETAPYDFLGERFKSWFHDILPSMEKHEEKTLDLFYATDLIRPEQAIASIEKGPFEAERSILGSSAPSSIEILPYQYGIGDWKPATLAGFPFPKAPTDLLKETRFYDEPTITVALKETVSLLQEAFEADFSPSSLTALISQTGKLTESSGGINLCPYHCPFPTPSVEESATDVLDVVIMALQEKQLTNQLPHEALEQHKIRLTNHQQEEGSIKQILNAIKTGIL